MAKNNGPENMEPGDTTPESAAQGGPAPETGEAAKKDAVKVVVDKAGTVEVTGPDSPEHFAKVAERLGLKSAETLLRQSATPQVMNHVIGRARILGYELEVRDPAKRPSRSPARPGG
jgi:hypothetical protein